MSEVSIVNRALARLGSDPITSLSASDTKSGRCNQLYGSCRDELLAGHPWNFAMTRAALPALTDAPVWDYDYAYELPVNCLRVWRIDGHPLAKWKVEGRTIVTDLTAPLNILYIAQITDTAQFSTGFAFALSMRLAAELAMPLTQNATMFEAMATEADRQLRRAKSADAMEGLPDQVYADTFNEARFYGAVPSWYRG